MAVLLPDQLDDFVQLTLNNIKRGSWVDISLTYQDYFFAQMIQRNKKSPERGGAYLEWKVQTTNTGTAKHTEMYAVDTTSVKDLMQPAKEPWTKQTVNFSYDIDEELLQTDRETIIREIEVRDHSMYNDFFELMETAMWSAPTSSTQSPRPPSGIPYWIVKDATTTPTGGLEGGNPSGFTSGAGNISSSTYAQWDNWAFGYTNVTRDDLLERWAKACEFTKFRAPRQYAELGGSVKGPADLGHFTTYTVVAKLEKLLQNQNDNLGADLWRYGGQAMFKGAPVHWVPYLQTNDSADPIYGVNWKTFMYFFRKGANMRRSRPEPAPGQHTVRRVHMDNWGNFACYNRRLNFVGSTS